MKILAVSDLHGFLPKIETPFDLLLICGDVCPAHDHYYAFQIEWMKNDFVNWVNSLPFKNVWSKVVMTWGNHDFVGERASVVDIRQMEIETGCRLKILRHDMYEFEYLVSDGIDSLTIFGTPYCKVFGTWAFMVENDTLEKKYSQIPEGVDILISHDSPTTNNLGFLYGSNWGKIDAGNPILAKHIERIKPKMFFSGHLHSGNHNFEKVGDTWMANVSMMSEGYEPFYNVLEIDYNEETRTIENGKESDSE